MQKDKEAESILEEHLGRYKLMSYDDLRARIGQVEAYEVTGSSGKQHQLEFEVHWDDKPEGDIRVLGAIDDGGWSAFSLLSNDFIVTRHGQLVD